MKINNQPNKMAKIAGKSIIITQNAISASGKILIIFKLNNKFN